MTEPKGRSADWTEERGTNDEGRRRPEAPRRREESRVGIVMGSDSDWPVMQNATILRELMMGTTLAASSEVHPMTSARLEVVANICVVAGTASAGSPRVSTPLQLSLWPRTPPALLIACVAPSQETR